MLMSSTPVRIVSVTTGALKHAGLIHYKNGCMTILDRPGLEAAACECYGNVQRQFEQLLGWGLRLGVNKPEIATCRTVAHIQEHPPMLCFRTFLL